MSDKNKKGRKKDSVSSETRAKSSTGMKTRSLRKAQTTSLTLPKLRPKQREKSLRRLSGARLTTKTRPKTTTATEF